MERQVTWYGYWMVLGIASSVGLGSGLHTFLLFLGPYIAEVTMALHECNTIDGMTRNLSTQVKKKRQNGVRYELYSSQFMPLGIDWSVGHLR